MTFLLEWHSVRAGTTSITIHQYISSISLCLKLRNRVNEWMGRGKEKWGRLALGKAVLETAWMPSIAEELDCITHLEECCNALGLSQWDASLQVNFSAPAFIVIFHNPPLNASNIPNDPCLIAKDEKECVIQERCMCSSTSFSTFKSSFPYKAHSLSP